MTRTYTTFATLLGFFSLFSFSSVVVASYQAASAQAISHSKYSKAHSLGDNYIFDVRDGWHTVNATDFDYKYHHSARFTPEESSFQRRTKKKAFWKSKSAISGALNGVMNRIWKGLKGLGKPEDVYITWYTGHDLEKPSCWENGKWAPTDNSFACALTLNGWANRPQCFKFLELCNTPKKCIFVRVVDTCAGCAAGSHHVDLTRAAFKQLANFDQGILSVAMRTATEPTEWYDYLWGPRV